MRTRDEFARVAAPMRSQMRARSVARQSRRHRLCARAAQNSVAIELANTFWSLAFMPRSTRNLRAARLLTEFYASAGGVGDDANNDDQ